MKRTKIVDALACTDFGKDINVKGWVRSHRSSKAVDFIALNDGSTIKNIQVVVDPSTIDEDKLKSINNGCLYQRCWYARRESGCWSDLRDSVARRLKSTVSAQATTLCRRRDRASSICVSMATCVCAQILSVLSSVFAITWQLLSTSTSTTMVSIISTLH